MTSNQPKKVIILGALSAVAEQVARIYAEEGAALLLAARKGEHLEGVASDLRARGAAQVKTATLDLASADAAFEAPKMIEALGGADHIVLAYGVLGDQERGEADQAEATRILQVDFMSAAQWCMAFARHLETQRSGALVVIGSVAGDRGRASNYLYGAAKGGLAILVQGLAHRLSRVGVRAVIIKPGFIDTPMTASFKKGPLWAKPSAIAAIVRRAAERGGPIQYAPGFWRLIMLIIRTVPAFVFHRTKL